MFRAPVKAAGSCTGFLDAVKREEPAVVSNCRPV